MTADPDWWSLDKPWRVKILRADEHIAELKARVADFRTREPFGVEYEPAEHEHVQRVRLVSKEPIPPALGAVVGDIAHNLRSALDSVAYYLARADFAGQWTPSHEKAPAFPIRKTRKQFDNFFASRSTMPEDTFSQRAQDALRFAQPFYWADEFPEIVVDLDAEFEHSTLRAIQEASNIDKHRRLLVAAWTPTFMHWGSSEGESTRRLMGPQFGDPGDVVAYQYDPPSGPADSEVIWEISLVLREEGFPPDQALEKVVDDWRQQTAYAVQSIFTVWEASAAKT